MTLTWAEIDERWPDAGVMWDRDVAPTLDWEPRLRARGDQLWADDPECSQRGHGRCRCVVWWNSNWSTLSHHGAWQSPLGAQTRIDDLADDYRRRLGLLPWPEQVRRADEMVRDHDRVTGTNSGHGRRSGRTTYGLLRAIAMCVLSGHRVLVIVGAYSAATSNIVHSARELLARLGIDGIQVEPNGRGRRDGINYRDHHLDVR